MKGFVISTGEAEKADMGIMESWDLDLDICCEALTHLVWQVWWRVWCAMFPCGGWSGDCCDVARPVCSLYTPQFNCLSCSSILTEFHFTVKEIFNWNNLIQENSLITIWAVVGNLNFILSQNIFFQHFSKLNDFWNLKKSNIHCPFLNVWMLIKQENLFVISII